MKKIITSVIILVLIASITVFALNAFPQPEADKKFTKNGDVDYSGSIELVDAMMMFRFTAGKDTFDTFTVKVGDLDKSGKIELSDTMKVFRCVAGKEKLPIFPLFDDQPMEYDLSLIHIWV